MKTPIWTCCILVLIAGTTPPSKSEAAAVSIAYGRILSVQQIEKSSAMGGGALVGGLLGMALSDGNDADVIGDGLAGAAAGGVMAGVAEGDRRTYRYDIQLTDGTQIRIVTDQGGLRVDDCTSVEQSGNSAKECSRNNFPIWLA